MPHEVVDEIAARFSDITINHLRTVMFYDVLLEEGEMHLIKVLLAKSPAAVKMVIKRISQCIHGDNKVSTGII